VSTGVGLVAYWQAKAAHSLQQRGMWGTIRRAAGLPGRLLRVRWVWWRLDNPWLRYTDRQFDRRYGVDTADVVGDYGPTHAGTFTRALRDVDVDYRRFAFIDFGCGKGKALLLAARRPFKRIIGVELAPELVDVARRNVAQYVKRSGGADVFELVCADAAEYRIPHDPAVFFFFNPFRAETMRPVLDNIRRSLEAAPREIYVIYKYPLLRSVLDECGFLTPLKQTSLYVIYRTARDSGHAPHV